MIVRMDVESFGLPVLLAKEDEFRRVSAWGAEGSFTMRDGEEAGLPLHRRIFVGTPNGQRVMALVDDKKVTVDGGAVQRNFRTISDLVWHVGEPPRSLLKAELKF